MAQYKLQGVDSDWEYPGALERGAQRADTKKYVTFLKEMQASFGTAYSITLTLALDYWYLRWFDTEAMEPYII
jgi:chitinase